MHVLNRSIQKASISQENKVQKGRNNLFGFLLVEVDVSTFLDNFEDGHRRNSTDARAEPVDEKMFGVGVTFASPLETGSKDRIEVAAGIVEGENNQCGADEWVDHCAEAWINLSDAFWSETAQEGCDAFDSGAEVWINL